ncbi:MAG TPA: ABC transporter ATP-binding protein [Devosiaceae bacterium]
MTGPVLEARGLTKRYGRATAVTGLDLAVNAGEVFGLLGPNGSGKTTTILMLLGLTEPSEGEVRVLGHNPLREPLAVKREVGYLPDAVGFYDGLTARENLRYTARLSGVPETEREERIAKALERVRLSHVADRRVKTFSRGMRQRLGLAEIVAKGCRIAILDEPTSGLDPQSTHELLELIRSFAADGMTVLLSSHLLSMVQSICDRVALFREGQVGLVGTVPDIAAKVLGGLCLIDVEADGVDLQSAIGPLEGVRKVTVGKAGTAQVDADADIRPDIASAIVKAGGSLKRIDISHSDLDDVYVRYFEGKEDRDAA